LRSSSSHVWDVTAREAVAIQEELRERVVLENDFGRVEVVAGVDMAVDSQAHEGYGGAIAFTFPGLAEIERRIAVQRLTFPYVPGLLSFREAPVVLEALEGLKVEADVILVDGQGIAHPRGVGIASHLGIILDKPTIGCAKSRLVGSFEEPGMEAGDCSPLIYQGKVVGAVLRTRRGVRPIFVSPGHKIDLPTSIEITLKCVERYRIPKPTREADLLVGEAKRKGRTDL